MNELLMALALLTGLDRVPEAARPQPTKEQEKLIELLGHPDWQTREKADKELLQLGYAALVALERKGFTSDDPEIRTRAVRIRQSYYKFGCTKGTIPDVTGLFKLKEITLKNGKTITIEDGTAKRYLLAVAEGNIDHEIFQSYNFNDHDWMLRDAVRLFTKDLYRAGYLADEVVQVLDAIEANQSNWKAYDLKHDESVIESSGQFDGHRP